MKLPRVRMFLAWFDLWVGLYWDRKARTLYLCPLPCVAVALEFGPPRDIRAEVYAIYRSQDGPNRARPVFCVERGKPIRVQR